jgi:hypothetical protein
VFAVVFLLALPAAYAELWVGGNIDVHNNTGVTAHDFHIRGRIKSTTLPELDWQTGYVSRPGGRAYFPNFSHSITHDVDDWWNFDAEWSSEYVADCEVGHFGLVLDATCRNVWMYLDGWWTDAAGNPIPGGDLPIPGFEVPTHWWDPPPEQRFILQGDAGEARIDTQILQMDLVSIPLPSDPAWVVDQLNVEQMHAFAWESVIAYEDPAIDFPAESFFDVFTEPYVGPIGPDQWLMARTLIAWPGEEAGRWVFHVHQSHPVPEPLSMIFFGTGVVAVAGVVARRKRTA